MLAARLSTARGMPEKNRPKSNACWGGGEEVGQVWKSLTMPEKDTHRLVVCTVSSRIKPAKHAHFVAPGG